MSESAGSRTTPWEVQGTFATPEQMQDAVTRLSMSGFDRADMSLPSPELVEGRETPDAGTKPVYDDADARQGRTVGASTAASAAALAAAGITIATGGAAAPAIVAAVLPVGPRAARYSPDITRVTWSSRPIVIIARAPAISCSRYGH